MSAFFALQAKKNVIVETLFKKIDTATDTHEAENHAATKIQSVARMRQQRKIFLVTLKAVVDMQRVFRGYCGRKKAVRTQIARLEAFNRAVFHHFATVIQSRFRGFYARKYVSDFYARKKYLAKIVDVSENVRAEAQRVFEEQQKLHEAAIRASQGQEYGQVTSKMHHLLSTASISGIYRQPLSKDGMQTVFGTNIEDDLREVSQRRKFKPDLPAKSMTSGGKDQTVAVVATHKASSAAESGTLKSSPEKLASGRGSFLSSSKKVLRFPHEKLLQNSVTYDFEHEELQLQLAVEKSLANSLHDKPFIAKKPDPPKMPRPIAVETPYVGKSSIARR